jgi:hypothetical protein
MDSAYLPYSPLILAASVAAISSGRDDIFALTGASVATMVAAAEHRQSGRSWKDLIGIVIVTFFLGSTIPGLISLTPMVESMFKEFRPPWQFWALSGFVCGTMGWGMYHAARPRLEIFIQKLLSKIS